MERRIVECDQCGEKLQSRNLSKHLETVHDIYRSKVIDRDIFYLDREASEAEADFFCLSRCTELSLALPNKNIPAIAGFRRPLPLS